MFKLYDKVIITANKTPGTIIDIIEKENGEVFTVESDIKGEKQDAYGGIWPIYECSAEEIIRR